MNKIAFKTIFFISVASYEFCLTRLSSIAMKKSKFDYNYQKISLNS